MQRGSVYSSTYISFQGTKFPYCFIGKCISEHSVTQCSKMSVMKVFALRCWTCLSLGTEDHFSSKVIFTCSREHPSLVQFLPWCCVSLSSCASQSYKWPKWKQDLKGTWQAFSLCSAVVKICSLWNLEDIWQVEKLKTRGHTFNASLETRIKHLVTPVWEANPQRPESIWQRNTFCLGLDLGREKKKVIFPVF